VTSSHQSETWQWSYSSTECHIKGWKSEQWSKYKSWVRFRKCALSTRWSKQQNLLMSGSNL